MHCCIRALRKANETRKTDRMSAATRGKAAPAAQTRPDSAARADRTEWIRVTTSIKCVGQRVGRFECLFCCCVRVSVFGTGAGRDESCCHKGGRRSCARNRATRTRTSYALTVFCWADLGAFLTLGCILDLLFSGSGARNSDSSVSASFACVNPQAWRRSKCRSLRRGSTTHISRKLAKKLLNFGLF